MGNRNVLAIYIRKKAGLIFIEDVPRTYPAPEKAGAGAVEASLTQSHRTQRGLPFSCVREIRELFPVAVL